MATNTQHQRRRTAGLETHHISIPYFFFLWYFSNVHLQLDYTTRRCSHYHQTTASWPSSDKFLTNLVLYTLLLLSGPRLPSTFMHITNIPEEILDRAVDALASPIDLRNLAAVCSQFHSLVEPYHTQFLVIRTPLISPLWKTFAGTNRLLAQNSTSTTRRDR
jgi:hypothetical protein